LRTSGVPLYVVKLFGSALIALANTRDTAGYCGSAAVVTNDESPVVAGLPFTNALLRGEAAEG
jgi:hypothetical protein